MKPDPEQPDRDEVFPLRVIIDTSVLIRYLIRPSAAIRTLVEHLWLSNQVQMVTCPELLAELEGVLQRDYMRTLIQPAEANALLRAVRRKAEFLPSLGTIPSYTRDRKDDKFIACAVVGRVRYVLTVDKDLLEMEALADIEMLTPHAFLAKYWTTSETS